MSSGPRAAPARLESLAGKAARENKEIERADRLRSAWKRSRAAPARLESLAGKAARKNKEIERADRLRPGAPGLALLLGLAGCGLAGCGNADRPPPLPALTHQVEAVPLDDAGDPAAAVNNRLALESAIAALGPATSISPVIYGEAPQRATVRARLLGLGIEPARITELRSRDLEVNLVRYQAKPPDCGDIEPARLTRFGECISAANLAAALADPQDLIAPPRAAGTDAIPAINAIEQERRASGGVAEIEGPAVTAPPPPAANRASGANAP